MKHSNPSLTTGLSQAEATTRLTAEGPNELPKGKRRSPLRIIFDVLQEPMLALLLAGGVVYLLLGSREEALILLAFACLSVGITVVQEARTERVLEALRDLTSPRALVIRDGQRQRIAGRELVRGDVIVLAEGDRVPADAALIDAQDLSADESLLTGEAVPVRKLAGAATEARPGGEDQPMVYSGSLIVRGTGVACVTATGKASEIGKIGTSLGKLDTETPHLQRQMRKLVIVFAAVGAAVSVAVVALYGLLRGGWLDGVLAGIAVGMSMLPEEFPMVLAVFMAMGAWRISKVRVLTRRASAIETLGAASVLCTDKTGTLTENRMTIAELRLPDGTAAKVGQMLPEAFRELAAAGVMASAPEPFDPMEKAFHALSKADLREDETLPGTGRQLVRSYPVSPELLAMSQVWGAGEGWQIAAKGAPEALAVLCRLDKAARARMTVEVDQMAGAGLRVLGVAEASQQGTLPKDHRDFCFRFLGLVGLADPLRASVPDAVAQCRSAGIRVIMITGDYPTTAQAIAAEAGLHGDRVISGPELAAITDVDLATAVRDVTIFARVMPEQKLRIVTALKTSGAVVAMTGDGVNDAPSLKAANIGIAMGGRGTDVAREAASIVLLDDDFGSIVTTVRLGRRIYDNLRKAMSFILAVHVPIAGMALMPLLFGMPILFGPMHIAFLEMVIDPVCSLVFEAETEEDDVMTRKPRPPGEPLFSGPTILWSLVQGALVLAVKATIFALAPGYGMTTDQVRGMTFAALVFAIVALILVDRSRSSSILRAVTRPNRALAVVLPIVGALLAVTLFWPTARDLFGFAALGPAHLAVPPLAGLTVLLALEVMKPIWRWAVQRNKAAPAITSGKIAVH
ncbi:cation-translocating P-type ATPase [Tabrizicola piscis]|uniref:Cation-translocating P-type ATPase n=1 Tax=Tabrizicola piscis TaxID=2494374 RepID=A0A3S8U7M8_9RHOB|nr:cation-translocating P-type ATPase [Tabrizicola piscis]AZL59540.1 cation-translocating P-type ATPase [Tabrizicola piscis]